MTPTEIATLTWVSRTSVGKQLDQIREKRPYGAPATPQNTQSPKAVVERREIVEKLHKEDVAPSANCIRRLLWHEHDIEASHSIEVVSWPIRRT
jgi:hypothetical protein